MASVVGTPPDIAISEARREKRRRVAYVAGAAYLATVIAPLVAFPFTNRSSSVRTAFVSHALASVALGLLLWARQILFKRTVKPSRARKHTIAWAWTSTVASSEFALLFSLAGESVFLRAVVLAFCLTMRLAAFVQFSGISHGRASTIGCMFVCSVKIFEAPFVCAAALLTAAGFPIFCVILVVPYAAVAAGMYLTLPPHKSWENYDVPRREPPPARNTLLSHVQSAGGVERVHTPKVDRPISPSPRWRASEGRPIRVVQITDMHLSPITTVKVMRDFCEDVVYNVMPDLVLLTGDMLAGTKQSGGDALVRALEPLKRLRGRTFACLGVIDAIEAVGIKLLRDESAIVEVEGRQIQIIGIDYRKSKDPESKEAVVRVCGDNPRPFGCEHRIILLHDPSSFQHVPLDDGALVLSGHTHGGVLGIVGMSSMVSLADIPDNGLWRRGTNVLYVHRGQGTRSLLGNILVRFFIPPEQSVLWLH